jgi:hypothetical protein
MLLQTLYKGDLLFPWAPRRTLHPQVAVFPFFKLVAKTFAVPPQSHLHSHRERSAALLFCKSFKQTSSPNLLPVKSSGLFTIRTPYM